MTTLTLDTLTPDETQRLAAEAAGAGAESVPEYVAGLLRARWERMEAVEPSCSNCGFESVCDDTESPTGWCSEWYEALHAKRVPAQEQAREGVAVEEGEAGAVWLGDKDGRSGAAFEVSRYGAEVSGAYFEDVDGEGVETLQVYGKPDLLNGSQLRTLADHIADLYQCAECDGWYRGGTICPRCGEERKE